MLEKVGNLSKSYKPVLAFFCTSLIISILILYFFSPISNWIHFPLSYSEDGLWNLFISKTVVDTGWYASNTHLGAPFGAIFLDFPKPETLHLAFIRLTGFFTTNIVIITNFFYFFGFFAVAWSALWVLRLGLGLEWILAIIGAVIYTILPFHFLRLEHLFLSNYFVVPLIVWLVLQLSKPNPPFYNNGQWHIASGIFLILIMVASTSVYYTYFALMLVVLTGLIESLRKSSFIPMISSGIIVLTLAGILLINLSPSLIYKWREGPNAMAAHRTLADVDRFALRPIELMLPMLTHHSTMASESTKKYNFKMQMKYYEPSYLGLIASFGFLILCLNLFTGQILFKGISNVFHCLTRMNGIAVCLGIAGGINAFVGFFVSSQFRCMSRISIIIGFISLAGLLLLIQHWLNKMSSRKKQALFLPLILILFAVAVWDQIPNELSCNPNLVSYQQDHSFFQNLEKKMPLDARIYQLPHIKFPEAMPHENEGMYAQIKPFLHTTHVHWSFGGMNNKESDLWQEALDTLPINVQLQVLEKNNFIGILIERLAYRDQGENLERNLKNNGLTLVQNSPDNQFAFYSFPSKIEQKGDIIAGCQFGEGFYQEESDGKNFWHWSSGSSTLNFYNYDSKARRTFLSFSIGSLLNRKVTMVINGQQIRNIELKSGSDIDIALELVLKPGLTKLQFTTDVPAEVPNFNDLRLLAFLLKNFKYTSTKDWVVN